MGVPVSWQMGVEFARESSMFLRMVSSAPRAAEPGSSFSMEARKRSSTSFGRLDDVRRISSRISLVMSRMDTSGQILSYSGRRKKNKLERGFLKVQKESVNSR